MHSCIEQYLAAQDGLVFDDHLLARAEDDLDLHGALTGIQSPLVGLDGEQRVQVRHVRLCGLQSKTEKQGMPNTTSQYSEVLSVCTTHI